MSSRFIENASRRGVTFEQHIIPAIRAAHSVDIAVSYLQMSGWFVLRRELERLPLERIRILTTDQMNVTQPTVLRDALSRGIYVRCYRGSRVFHPKVYVLHGSAKTNDIAIVGSANISTSGLSDGVEAGIRISDVHICSQLARWFDALFRDPSTRRVDEAFVKDYEQRWKQAAKARLFLLRVGKKRKRRSGQVASPTPEEKETLEDVFSTIVPPVGTLGFDQAGNNIRNVARLLDVLARYPRIGSKEKSELRLLGFMHDGRLTALGVKARSSRTSTAVAKLWTSWLKKQPDASLDELNPRLKSFKRAVGRFWHLKPDVRRYFLHNLADHSERETLQAIELCCNASAVVDSLSVADFRQIAPFMVTGNDLSEFIKDAIENYRHNKGSRSWTGDDRRIVLNSWG